MSEPYILIRSLGRKCGMAEYAGFLAERLPGKLVGSVLDLPLQRGEPGIVIVQVEVGLYNLDLGEIIWELTAARARGYVVIADYASEPDSCQGWSQEIAKHAILGPKYTEPNSFLLPLVRCNPLSEPDLGPPDELRIGTFGFSSPVKKNEKVIALALRLGIKATIISTMPDPYPDFNESPHIITPMAALYETNRAAAGHPEIEVIAHGYLSVPDVQRKLRQCSHLVSAMDNLTANWGPSGSLRTMATVGRPLIALKSQRAAEVDAILVDSLDDITVDFLEQHRTPPDVNKIGDGLWAYKNLIRWIQVGFQHNKMFLNLDGGNYHV